MAGCSSSGQIDVGGSASGSPAGGATPATTASQELSQYLLTDSDIRSSNFHVTAGTTKGYEAVSGCAAMAGLPPWQTSNARVYFAAAIAPSAANPSSEGDSNVQEVLLPADSDAYAASVLQSIRAVDQTCKSFRGTVTFESGTVMQCDITIGFLQTPIVGDVVTRQENYACTNGATKYGPYWVDKVTTYRKGALVEFASWGVPSDVNTGLSSSQGSDLMAAALKKFPS